MTGSRVGVLCIATLCALALSTREGEAQVRVTVDVHLGDRPGDADYRDYRDHYDRRGRPAAAYGVRVPPGHYPAPGYCRPWFPGVPPGHQPRAVPCHLLRYVPAGAVVIGGWEDYGRGRGKDHRDDYYYEYEPRRDGPGRGRGRFK